MNRIFNVFVSVHKAYVVMLNENALPSIEDHKNVFKQNQSQDSVEEHKLTLKAPITTAADDKYCDFFPNFRKK